MKITIEAEIAAPVEAVWQAWNNPEDIVRWNAASDDWHTTHAEVDLKVGGVFSSRMEAKDGSMGFDFFGTYTTIEPLSRIEYTLGDNRTVQIEFRKLSDTHTFVQETFDAEGVHPPEHQKAGWQAILNRFAQYVTTKA